MLRRIARLVADDNAAALTSAGARALTIPQPTLATMAARTVEIYEAATARAAGSRDAATEAQDSAAMRRPRSLLRRVLERLSRRPAEPDPRRHRAG